MSNCNHDCGSCGQGCGDKNNGIPMAEMNVNSDVRKVIGVVSGKGGVGKSSVTSMLAVAAARAGKSVAILDGDITGPSIPNTFGLNGHAEGDGKSLFPMMTKEGIKVMSINLLLENKTDPVVWRGPVLGGVITQFWSDVIWGDVDVMFVDMPPGTGDVALTVYQSLPVDGIIVVTSPQQLVGMIVEKATKMADMMSIPILGLVENMSYFKCPDCGSEHKIFGESNIDEIAAKHGIKNIAKLSIDPELAKSCDEGRIEDYVCKDIEPLAKRIIE